MSIFTGAGVALVTPMHADGSVNFDKMKELIEFQIANDTDALIICGTTGEASTMSDEVQIECIRFAKEAAAGLFPLSRVQAAMIPHTVSNWHRAAKRQALMPFCW